MIGASLNTDRVHIHSYVSVTAKIPHISLPKGPAQLVTTVREALPAPHHREIPTFLSTDPAPKATTAHRVLCSQCPALWGQQGTSWVSICPVSSPLLLGDPNRDFSLWCSELSISPPVNSNAVARNLTAWVSGCHATARYG